MLYNIIVYLIKFDNERQMLCHILKGPESVVLKVLDVYSKPGYEITIQLFEEV